MAKDIQLQVLLGHYAVSRLDPRSAFPAWADGPGFVSICRSDDELSIVCLEDRVPAGLTSTCGWTAIKFVGPFAFDETGIVLSVVRPLSEGGLGIFIVSSFDGDHLLVRTADWRARRLC
jgi:hypothetical protein